jgi:hypothetical protein
MLPPVKVDNTGFEYDSELGWAFGLSASIAIAGGHFGGKVLVVQPAIGWESPLVGLQLDTRGSTNIKLSQIPFLAKLPGSKFLPEILPGAKIKLGLMANIAT